MTNGRPYVFFVKWIRVPRSLFNGNIMLCNNILMPLLLKPVYTVTKTTEY